MDSILCYLKVYFHICRLQLITIFSVETLYIYLHDIFIHIKLAKSTKNILLC